jgi:hypothetical protein
VTHSQPSSIDFSTASVAQSTRLRVCSQKPQKENSAGRFGWGTIEPLQI